MKLGEITKDDDIYPRIQISQKTIESYAEAVKAGEQFPPIYVQKISINDEEKTICLDGWHRLEAYKAYNKLDGVKPIKEVEVTYWKDEVLDKDKNIVDLLEISYELNAKQGLRPTQADAKSQLEKIARTPDALNLIWKDIAKRFGVTPEWVSECVASILAEKRMSRDAFMYKLSLMGWTSQEIGNMVGITDSAVRMAVSELKQFNLLTIKSDFYEKNKSAESIAEYYHLDSPLTWAILLEGKDNIERFKIFGKKEYGSEQPKLSDYWAFYAGKKDPRLGIEYEGHLFGQEVMNIIYRYSKQGDLVVDPMAGGGVTIDTCLAMGRKCRAYDINPEISGRRDIEQHDAREKLPQRAQNCDLIILDPPYYKKKEEEYGCEEFTEDRDKFIENMRSVASSCFAALKKGGYLALIYSQYIDYENEKDSILNLDLCKLFEEVGFRNILKIQSPLSFDTQWKPHSVNRAKEYSPWRILPVSRDWDIFKK